MNDMDFVKLIIQTVNGCFEIPFRGFEMLDEFTVRYNNQSELMDELIAMLGMSISKKDINNVYVYYEFEKDGEMIPNKVEVKYRMDNFDKNSIIESLKFLLKNNHQKIHECGVRKIRSKAIKDFVYNGEDIADFEIDFAVNKYFEGAPYRVYRKNYFFLKNNNVKVNINRFVRSNDGTIDRSLSKFHSEDDYVQSLLKLAKDSEDLDKIFEELAKIDLEDLKGSLTNSHFGLFDGVDNDKGYRLEDLYDLEMATGMDIDDLCSVFNKRRNTLR